MPTLRLPSRILAWSFAVLGCSGCSTLPSPRAGSRAAAGVVVESVKPGSAGEEAGLQPGDLILSWHCAASPPALPRASGGAVRSPYDLLPLEIEEAPRRTVTLRGKRGNQERIWTLTAAGWKVEARPVLPPGLTALYLGGKAEREAGDVDAAARIWRSAAAAARASGDGRLAAWLLDQVAAALSEARKGPEADAAYGEALAALRRESLRPAAARLLREWGWTLQQRDAWDAAIERLQQALAIERSLAPRSLALARTLDNLGVVLARRSDYPAAQELLEQALAIREELAPGTGEVTWSLNNLGILARRRGDLARAEEYLTRGEELQRRLAPDSENHALFFQNLGNVARDRGDLEKAEGFHRRALGIFEKVAPGEEGVQGCLENIAGVALLRGDLATAEELYRRSLALQKEAEPDELDASMNLIHLGNIASRRGDPAAAEGYFRQALAIQERISPDGREVANSLVNLGQVMTLQGDFAEARTCLRRALAISEKLAPKSTDVAEILENLGRLEMESGGDLAVAEALLRQALEIYQKEAPESLDISLALRDLGEAAFRRRRTPEAIDLYRRALDLQHKLAPESAEEARTLHLLGTAKQRAGRLEEGTRDLCRAIDIFDLQRGRIGGPQEARASFEATLNESYQACLEGLIGLGRPAEAFHALERGRARAFLDLLADRDLHLADLPPELDAERRHVNAEYDRVQAQLAILSSGRDDAEIERLAGELRELRIRQEEIRAKLRRDSPHPAALEAPQPLALAETRAVLDPGTVLLEYAVGPEKTWLFAVQPADAAGPGLSVFPIPAGADSLRSEVESFRRLLDRPDSDRAALMARARRLYGLLVQPAEAQVAGAQRILVAPDGPLHTLSFAALLHEDRWLAAWKPLHTALSATVYAELARSRPARPGPGEQRLAAFGDPLYPSTPEAPGDPEVQEAVRRGWDLQSLPSTRGEVEAIAALFPQARVYVGREATEERAKSLGQDSRLVHFACHGLLDERFPLNSALALTIPEHAQEGQDNGLLQAWEIFEDLRLDADLVTLSACDSALGQESGGEGLLGLTRAFQYAGARSVLASLWSVSDVSTAELMKRFYGYLREGRSKDEALQAAQLDLIRSPRGELSHPYHWAGFSLYGDWR